MGRVAAVLLVLPLLGQVGGEEVEEKVVKVVKEVGREGENICHTEELESHLVNTTYLESVKVGSKILTVGHFHQTVAFSGEETLCLSSDSSGLCGVGEQDGDQVEGGEHHQVNLLVFVVIMMVNWSWW